MACSNKNYNPKQYGIVNLWTKMFADWQDRIRNEYKPDVAEDLIAHIIAGDFDANYGKFDIKQIIGKKDPLTNDQDVTHLKAHYVTVGPYKMDSDFNKMKASFLKLLIANTLIDSNLKRIETDYITPDGITLLNENIYNMKMNWIKQLRARLFPSESASFIYTSDEAFSKYLSETISEYESKRISDTSLNDLWDIYFQLKYFDQLITDFKGFVKIKPEYANNPIKSNDMYIAVQPYVSYDTSFNPNEFASAEQYASEVLKTLLDYFKEYELNETPGVDSIGFKGFNYAVTRLVEWVKNQPNELLRRELDKGNNTNWGLLITEYVKSGTPNKEVIRKLNGLKHILSNSNLDSTIREMINEQKERVVRYQFESYRIMYDPKLRRNVLVPVRLEDTITDRQKGSVARSIRAKVNHFRNNPSEFDAFLKSHNIERHNDKITLKNFHKRGHDITINIVPDTTRVYRFEIDGYDASDMDDKKVKKLVEDLLQFQITDNYQDIFDNDLFNTKTMWGVFGNTIMKTLTASYVGENEFSRYEFRYNGNELELKGDSYYDLRIPAEFISLQNGVDRTTIVQNGLGNDLPIYQQISAIHKAQALLRNGRRNFEGIRSGIHSKNATLPNKRNTIFDWNILNPNELGISPIGAVVVRSDYDYDGTNKNSAQMNYNELTHVSIVKSFWENLNKAERTILLQTTCLSDKHTHFMAEFKTKQIKLRNGELLSDVLLSAGSANNAIRKGASAKLLNEIKYRRDKKVRVQIVNLLNRYNLAIHGFADATVEDSFESLLAKVKLLNDDLNKISKSDLEKRCRLAGVDYFTESDLIEFDGKLYINETLYTNFITYCDPNDERFKKRIAREQMAHAKYLHKNRFVLDGRLDPALNRAFNKFKAENPVDYLKWYDPTNNTMKVFRVYDADGNEVIPDYTQESISEVFDSGKYTVDLNPILNSHFFADILLSNSFNDIVFGDDYGLENKYLKEANQQIKKLRKDEENIKKKLSIATGENRTKLIEALNKARQDLSDLNYYSEKFRQFSEASRLTMHYKRTVHGGATYTPLLQGLKYGVAPKIKVAVVDDTKVPVFTITGQDKFTSQDGASWTSSYLSRMANRSYVDGAVGKNKKTIFSYVDPETGVLTLIKHAEYEITNAVRRDSPLDKEHASYEEAFRQMHSLHIEQSVLSNLDLSKYYNLQSGIPGITRIDPIYKKDINTGQHWLLKSVSNDGVLATAVWQEVDEFGKEIKGSIREQPEVIDSIYKLDQLFGGAFVEEMQDDGRLDWSEAQNDIVYQIICNENLKDYFIGFLVNASAMKSGMRNNNDARSFYAGFNKSADGRSLDKTKDELSYFEISSMTGGAQMNADHVISEAEVTEMSQMISALIQAGLKTKTVDKIYQFIGQVAADALGDITQWVKDGSHEEEVYKWIGEAVARAFETGSADTLGLAGAFIGRANKNLQEHGLKTTIPFSANTVKGIFEANITSYINSNAIRRKYPGGGFVQNPTYDVKPRYNFGGNSYSYTEFADLVRERYKGIYTVEQALTDISYTIDKNGEIVFNNPFIEKLDASTITSLDVDDTVVLYDSITGEITTDRLSNFQKYDEYRHFNKNVVGRWTCRPKNLLGSRTFFNVGNQKFSLYDLDSQRALMYCTLLLDGNSISTDAELFLTEFIESYNEELNDYIPISGINIFDLDFISKVKALAAWQLKQDLKNLSKIQENGQGVFKSQKSFNSNLNEVVVSNVSTSASQMLIGIADAKAFNITNTKDVRDINKDAYNFFKKKLNPIKYNIQSYKVDNTKYDATLYDSDGGVTLLVVGELHDNRNILNGMVPDPEYKIGEDGNIYKGEDELGISAGKEFYTIVGKDGVTYKVLYVHSMQDYKAYNEENHLYTNEVWNYTPENYRNLRDILYPTSSDGLAKLIQDERDRQIRNVDRLAKQKAAAWEAYKKGIGTRIPAQSMQSFTAVEIIGFTNDSVTNAYVSTTLADLQGSDFDIDKLYFMRYGLSADGKLVTFSNLENYFNPEKVLDLPKPSGRKISVALLTPETKLVNAIFGESAKEDDALYLEFGKGGVECIKTILESGKSRIYISPTILNDEAWIRDSLDTYSGEIPQPMTAERLQKLLDVHEKSSRSKALKNIALRNTVVRGILDVLTDASTQYNLQVPISMLEQQKAAELSTMAAEEKYLTSDNPSAKFVMQGQNMVGRDVIGIGAASLKAFFAASTYYNLQANKIAELLKQPDSIARNEEIWKAIRNVCFNAKFGDRTLVTLANINWDNAIAALNGVETIEVSKLELTDVNSYLADEKNGYIINNYNTYTINIAKLLEDLDKASNGSWDSPIDAAFSLSGLISAATDNAKELILAKINATSKFADIYTYLLSTGESFINIANFMTSPVFSIVAAFAEGNMLDSSTRFFDLEHSLNFVLDEETLPNVDNDIFMWILTNLNENNFITKLLYKSRTEANLDWILGFSENVVPVRTAEQVEAEIKRIVSNAKTNENEFTSEYKALVKYVYKSLRENPQYMDLLLDYLKTKVALTKNSDEKIDESIEYDLMIDDDYYMEAEDDVETTKSYNFNYSNLKNQDWINFYSYVKHYLKPKNEMLIGISDLSNLLKLKNDIIPALKEQRMLSKILGVNQGLNTKDFDEYKWIRDIESFVNERYINKNDNSFEEFDFIKFVSDTSSDPRGYRARQINQYEQVKSTYNILDIVSSVKQFNSMIELAGVNRKLIEKAYILKMERALAKEILNTNKNKVGTLSRGLMQKFNDKEYQVLKNFAQDLITVNWINTLSDISIRIPVVKDNPLKYYQQGELIEHLENSIKDVPLNSSDGMATFKWMMEHYIINKMRELYPNNPFIISLSESYRIDKDTESAITFLTLPIDLGHADENSKTEQLYNMYLAGFNQIWKDEVPEEWGIGEWTIGDLFYLYNLYVHKDGFGQNSLTRIFDNVVLSDDDNTLLNRFYKHIVKLDSGIEKIEDIETLSPSLINELRIALSRQNSAASKFRVKFVQGSNWQKSEYQLLNSDYSVQDRIPISMLNKSDYLFGFTTRYNPIKINVTTDSAKILQGKGKRKREVSGREAIRLVVREFQKAFDDKLPIKIIDTEWLESASDAFKSDKIQNAKSFIRNGIIYVNIDKAKAGSLVHEFMHVILAKLKYSNDPEQRRLYYNMLRSIKEQVKSQNEFWTKYWNQVEEKYSGYVVGSDFEEEVFANAVEDLFSTGYYANMGVKTGSGSITASFNDFANKINEAVAKLFIIPPQQKDANILNMSLADMVVDLSSGLFDLSQNNFMRYYIPLNQKLSAFKRQLVQNSEDDNAKDYLTIEGDC